MATPRTKGQQSRAERAAGVAAGYPSHEVELDALARIEGQVRGLMQMIEDKRYCMDILIQARAVHAALGRVERNILRSYLRTCVQHAFCSDSTAERDRKIDEILELFERKALR